MTKNLNSSDFNEAIKDGVTLVDFYATWCGPCRMIVPVVEALAQAFAGKAKVAKVDIDQAQDVASTLQITSVPTVIIFKNGKEVERVIGVKDEDFFTKLLQKHV